MELPAIYLLKVAKQQTKKRIKPRTDMPQDIVYKNLVGNNNKNTYHSFKVQ